METFPEQPTRRAQIRDDRLLQRAIKQRWPIPEQFREAVIARQVLIATGRIEDASPREQTAAFNALLAAEAQNQADEHQDEGKRVEHRHTIELGPVTAENLAEHKRRLLEELGT